MKIAHVSDFYLPRLGGIETHVHDLAGLQRDLGHEIHVVTSTTGPAAEGVHRVAGVDGGSHQVHPFAFATGVKVLRALDVDVVHAHLGVASPLAFFGARSAARAGIPTVVTVHSMWAGVGPIMATMDAVGGWSGLPIAWTAVSEAATVPVRRHLRPGTPITVLSNGIHQDGWRMPAATERPGELRLVAVMRLARRKRPLALLRIFRDAQATLARLGDPTRLHLVVAGEGPALASMERYLRRHGLSDQVTLIGRLPRHEIRPLLGASHGFLAPADLESFGIAALEARCAGLPVVAKSQGGVREFVRHEHEGLLCASDDEMVDAVVRLARDPALRQRIADHNRTSQSPAAWGPLLNAISEVYDRAFRLQAASHSRPVLREAR